MERFESPVYMTNSGIVNEAGIAMENTIGKYAYRYIILPIDKNISVVWLCSESFQVEELKEYVKFYQQSNDFAKKLEDNSAIEK